MKKVLAVLFLLIGSVSLSKAQGGPGHFPKRTPEERVKMQMERLPQTLSLTEEQRTKIAAIYLSQSKSRDSLITSMRQGGDREAMRAKIMELNAASDKQITALLSDEQKKAYAAYVQERGTRGFGGGRPRPAQGNR